MECVWFFLRRSFMEKRIGNANLFFSVFSGSRDEIWNLMYQISKNPINLLAQVNKPDHEYTFQSVDMPVTH